MHGAWQCTQVGRQCSGRRPCGACCYSCLATGLMVHGTTPAVNERHLLQRRQGTACYTAAWPPAPMRAPAGLMHSSACTCWYPGSVGQGGGCRGCVADGAAPEAGVRACACVAGDVHAPRPPGPQHCCVPRHSTRVGAVAPAPPAMTAPACHTLRRAPSHTRRTGSIGPPGAGCSCKSATWRRIPASGLEHAGSCGRRQCGRSPAALPGSGHAALGLDHAGNRGRQRGSKSPAALPRRPHARTQRPLTLHLLGAALDFP